MNGLLKTWIQEKSSINPCSTIEPDSILSSGIRPGLKKF
jgi:hypothetical protein